MIRYTDFRNTKVRFSDKGKGRVIVLLHGFPESLEVFENLSDKLSKYFRVVCIDLPGHGKTPVLGYAHSMELMAACVKTVLDALKIKQGVIAGHSMGGYVSLAFAELYPDSLAGLCLFHSTAMPDSNEKKKERDRIAKIIMNNHEPFIANLIPKYFAPENLSLFKTEVKQATDIALQTSKEGIVAALMGMKMRPNRELILKHAKFPVLFIIGKKDSILAWENVLLLASLPRKSSQLVLENAGHMGFYEASEECFKGLKKFVKDCYKK